MKRYLLILPCSKDKKELEGAPAIEIYNGPYYKIIRKYDLTNIDILIISAKYGLIQSNDLITNYDKKMNPTRAEELSFGIKRDFKKFIENKEYEGVFITLGKHYMMAFNGCITLLNTNEIIVSKGMIGERLHELKNWISMKADEKETSN